jgi:hypothetical protein
MTHHPAEDTPQLYIEAFLLAMIMFLAFALIGTSLGAYRTEDACRLPAYVDQSAS